MRWRRAGVLIGPAAMWIGLLGVAAVALIRYTSLQERGFRMMGIAGASGFLTLASVGLSLSGAAVAFACGERTVHELRRRAVALVGVAVLVHMSAPQLLGRLAPERTRDGVGFSVLAQNLWFKNPDLEGTLDAVLGTGADVLVLTEFTPQAADLLRRRPDAAAIRSAYPYRWTEPRPRGAGIAVLSALPIERVVPVPLSAPAATLTLEVGERSVELWAVHPKAPSDRWGLLSWQEDLRVLIGDAEDAGPATVMAGDFNASGGHRAFRALLARGELRDAHDAAGGPLFGTWPAGGVLPPLMRLDHVLVGAGVGIERVEVLTDRGSDHRGVQAWLRIPDRG